VNRGDFVWVKPMRSRDTIHPAVVLGDAQIQRAVLARFGINAGSVGWRVVLLDELMRDGVVRIFEATTIQIVRRMSPLEALAWAVADDVLDVE